jgi:hypothetical protein
MSLAIAAVGNEKSKAIAIKVSRLLIMVVYLTTKQEKFGEGTSAFSKKISANTFSQYNQFVKSKCEICHL